MKTFRKLSMAVALTLMLGTYALAGTVETPPGTVETPPAPQSATATGITIVLSLMQAALTFR
jgi:hypothetical protein